MKLFPTVALSLGLAICATASYADTLVTVRPAGTDYLDWSSVGGNGTSVPTAFSFTTANSVAGTGSIAGGSGVVLVQSNSWNGNFSAGDYLIWNQGNGAITLNFSQSYTQIGAQIQADYFGGFTAQLCNLAGCFTENGSSSSAGDGSAIYIGISSATPFNSVTFSLTSANGDTQDFALNRVTLNGGVAPTPEPSSLALLGTGVLSAAGMARRRFFKKA